MFAILLGGLWTKHEFKKSLSTNQAESKENSDALAAENREVVAAAAAADASTSSQLVDGSGLHRTSQVNSANTSIALSLEHTDSSIRQSNVKLIKKHSKLERKKNLEK